MHQGETLVQDPASSTEQFPSAESEQPNASPYSTERRKKPYSDSSDSEQDDHRRHRHKHYSRHKSSRYDNYYPSSHHHHYSHHSRNHYYSDDEEYPHHHHQHHSSHTPHYKSRRQASPSPAPAEETPEDLLARQKRTVFVYNLNQTVTESKLQEFFENRVGKVKDVRLIVDKATKRSRGSGYVQFQEEESVPSALNSTGLELDGRPIMVKVLELDKILANNGGSTGSSTTVGSSNAITTGGLVTKLFVKPIPDCFDEMDLKLLFESVGPLESIEIRKDVAGKRLGYGYVTYFKADDAKKALIKIHNLDLGNGIVIRLGMWNEARALVYNPKNAENSQEKKEVSSQNILLTNMFDPETETSPNFGQEIKEETMEECQKFGAVLHIFVDIHSKGHVYLRFDTIDSAMKAKAKLHGRWFAKKQISALFISDEDYFQQFPEAKTQTL